VFMVTAEPRSPCGELAPGCCRIARHLGQGRRVTVCFDRGELSPALSADNHRGGVRPAHLAQGPRPPSWPADTFTTITPLADDRGRQHQYDLADTAVT